MFLPLCPTFLPSRGSTDRKKKIAFWMRLQKQIGGLENRYFESADHEPNQFRNEIHCRTSSCSRQWRQPIIDVKKSR